MTRRWLVPGRSPRLVLAVAAMLAVAMSAAPGTARPVLAATSHLRYDATTTYTLDPAASAVHAVIKLKVTDLTPNSGGFIYFYDHIGLNIQQEAGSIRVSDSKGALSFTSKNTPAETIKGEHFLAGKDVVARLRADLFYKQSVTLTIAFELVGGPRSTTQVRVGPAFATFPAFVFGDSPHDTMSILVPSGWTTKTYYTHLGPSGSGATTTFTETPRDPETAWTIVYAVNDAGYAAGAVAGTGATPTSIEPEPGDAAWADAMRGVTGTYLPDLQAAVGLPWATAPVRLREVHVPDFLTIPDGALSATAVRYGWAQDAKLALITLPETLDQLDLLSGTAAYWFNGNLFSERWLNVGLARELAGRVVAAHGTAVAEPSGPAAEVVPLSLWPDPPNDTSVDIYTNVKRGKSREAERVQGAWSVTRKLLANLSEDQVRSILAAASARTNPYVGVGAAEALAGTPDWKRLLDLLEQTTGTTDAEAILTASVLTSGQAELLGPRTKARAEFAALVAAGNGWLPPAAVRAPLGVWDFTTAEERLSAAAQALGLRATVEAAEQAAGVSSSDALKDAYEAATAGFDEFTTLANAELGALKVVADGATAVAASRDLMTTVGLMGSDPLVPLAAAKAAYARGDLVGATSEAGAATSLITGAAAIGQQRLAIGVGVAVGIVVLLVAAVLLRRRRRRSRLPGAVRATSEPALAVVAGEGVGEPYATLPPDPAPLDATIPAMADLDGGSAPHDAEAGTS